LIRGQEALERLLSPTAPFDAAVHESHSARTRLLQLINNLAEVAEEDERDDIAALEAEIAMLKETVAGKNAAIVSLGGVIAPPAPTVANADTAAPTSSPQQSPSDPQHGYRPEVPSHYLQNGLPPHLKKPNP
jgi:hypothetical protein